jgi:hypothetical protein
MRIYTEEYSDCDECAEDALVQSAYYCEICNVGCDNDYEMEVVCDYINDLEICDECENDGIRELWGWRLVEGALRGFRIHVYVVDPEIDRY